MEPELAIATLTEMVALNKTGSFRIFESEKLKENLMNSIVTLVQLLSDYHYTLDYGKRDELKAAITPVLASALA